MPSGAYACQGRDGCEVDVLDGDEVRGRLNFLALKLLARDDEHRPQDAGDIRGLVRAATSDDIERARTSVALIEARGFARGRDLSGLLVEALARSTSA